MNFKARTWKKNSFIFGFGRGAQVGEALFLEVNLRRKRRCWAYHFLYGTRQALGSHQTSILEEDGAFFLTMRDKIVRRQPSWQWSDVVSQQCLRLRRFHSSALVVHWVICLHNLFQESQRQTKIVLDQKWVVLFEYEVHFAIRPKLSLNAPFLYFFGKIKIF